MKRIAIFCDGTWNRSDAKNATNVVKLAQAICPVAPDGTNQQVFYYPGVGTGRGSTRLARVLDRWGGGAFGWGLDENIHDAFRNLVFCYEPGDEIYIFGFSRGAFTARSLAGLIRKAGIPPRSQVPAIPEAIAMYRKRGDQHHPDAEGMLRFRAHLSPGTATSDEDLKWRQTNGYRPCDLLRITYLGVWDTVGGLGLPGILGVPAAILNEKYLFHDLNLSRSVRSARQALAADERRRLYPHSAWDNLGDLNGPEVTGSQRPYQQLWFAGTHSIVGGSGAPEGLTAIPLRWIAEGAMDLGLAIDEDMLEALFGAADPKVPGEAVMQAASLGNLLGYLLADRDLKPTEGEFHDSVGARGTAIGYKPSARFFDPR